MWLFPEASRLVRARKFLLPLGILLTVHRDLSRFPVNRVSRLFPFDWVSKPKLRVVPRGRSTLSVTLLLLRGPLRRYDGPVRYFSPKGFRVDLATGYVIRSKLVLGQLRVFVRHFKRTPAPRRHCWFSTHCPSPLD